MFFRAKCDSYGGLVDEVSLAEALLRSTRHSTRRPSAADLQRVRVRTVHSSLASSSAAAVALERVISRFGWCANAQVHDELRPGAESAGGSGAIFAQSLYGAGDFRGGARVDAGQVVQGSDERSEEVGRQGHGDVSRFLQSVAAMNARWLIKGIVCVCVCVCVCVKSQLSIPPGWRVGWIRRQCSRLQRQPDPELSRPVRVGQSQPVYSQVGRDRSGLPAGAGLFHSGQVVLAVTRRAFLSHLLSATVCGVVLLQLRSSLRFSLGRFSSTKSQTECMMPSIVSWQQRREKT
jgi:hypothetical protein